MKIIFVTWWVISWLGKGITAASIARLMKWAGYKVTMAKMDPYLQIDAGTMSPYEHGETFVTEDGFETDLDLGHYERYIDENLSRLSSITTWQIYMSVIQKERKWNYLGKTVQVIPHIINEIKERIQKLSAKSDVTVIEIWWTIGDIEWPHFVETMRQLRQELWKDNVVFVHVAPIIQVTTSGEMKTKAIQHSIIKLREMGIQADILACRTVTPIGEEIKKKLAMFCDIPIEQIIEAQDQNIYQVPLSFKKQNLDKILIQRLFQLEKESDLTKRWEYVHKLTHPKTIVNIGIAGKYTYLDDAYISVLEALNHAWAFFNTRINIERIDTEQFEQDDWKAKLIREVEDKAIDAILIPWGFGERGIQGMINIANYARQQNIPYLGLCLGLQIATISFARNVCQLPQAHSTEFDPQTPDPVIAIMEEQKGIDNLGGTMRLGSYPAVLKENTQVSDLYHQFGDYQNERGNLVQERHRHRREVNPHYHDILEENGLTISGKSPDGKLVEFVEIPEHPFYVATQAHPEFKSRLTKPHPLFLGLIQAISKQKKENPRKEDRLEFPAEE